MRGGNTKDLFDDAYETVESLGMQRRSLQRVTACCNILSEIFTLLFLLSAAASLTLQRCILNEVMHFMFLLPTFEHRLSRPSPFLTKHLEQQRGEKVKKRVRTRRPNCHYLHCGCTPKTPESLYLLLHHRTRRITSQLQDY